MKQAKRPNLILSLFPGIDLFGRAFEELGDSVVRGPDRLWGGDIRTFHPTPRVFDGVIGGSPCQDFSRARRTPPTGEGKELLAEFVRCVEESETEWFVLENVPGVPDVRPGGYIVQRFNLSAQECGIPQRRLRRFQFGSRDGAPLVVPRTGTRLDVGAPCCVATEGNKATRRTWADFCELQGLPRSFDLPGLSIAAKYRAVGNGVPLPMGRVVAIAIQRRRVTLGVRLCICECGRVVHGSALHATVSCRKRMERRRAKGDSQQFHRGQFSPIKCDAADVTGPGRVTLDESRFPLFASRTPGENA